jgi:hypothetical protein
LPARSYGWITTRCVLLALGSRAGVARDDHSFTSQKQKCLYCTFTSSIWRSAQNVTPDLLNCVCRICRCCCSTQERWPPTRRRRRTSARSVRDNLDAHRFSSVTLSNCRCACVRTCAEPAQASSRQRGAAEGHRAGHVQLRVRVPGRQP